jgi:putative Holliday junction resolvase
VTRLLAVDLGTRRIGLAIGESDAGGARPLATVARRRTTAADAEVLGTIARTNGIDEIIVGLPLDMDGGEGAMAELARGWAVAIAHHLGLPVRLRDERLSSHVAESRVGAPGRGRAGGPPGRVRRAAHRARIDREAAAVILEDELAARRGGDPGAQVTPPAAVTPPAHGAPVVPGVSHDEGHG